MGFSFPRKVVRWLPWLAVAALGVLNGSLYWTELRKPEETPIWKGRLMPGKPFPLLARPVNVAEEIPIPFANEPLRDMVIKDEPDQEVQPGSGKEAKVQPGSGKEAKVQPGSGKEAKVQPVSAKEVKPEPLKPEPFKEDAGEEEGKGGMAEFGQESAGEEVQKPSDNRKPSESQEDVGSGSVVSGFVVEAGTFPLRLGADTLVQRLQKQGMKPYVESMEEMVSLNVVQAGPFTTLAAAKEAEVKLKAGGYSEVRIDETWEGYIIQLGRYYLMGYAAQSMEQAEKLRVQPLRMIKILSPLPVTLVWLGPFSTQDMAKSVSIRISDYGLSVPVIRDVAKSGRSYTMSLPVPPVVPAKPSGKSEVRKPSDNRQPSDNQKPSDYQKPSDNQKPPDKRKPSDNVLPAKPVAPTKGAEHK